MTDELGKIQRWRNRAEECRMDAEAMREAEAKQTLLYIARIYDVLADRTEGLNRARKSQIEAVPVRTARRRSGHSGGLFV